MFRRAGERYVMLQDLIAIEDQQAIGQAVVQVMPTAAPSQHFVNQLSENLLAEARRQQAIRQKNTGRLLKLFGFLGGGLIPVVGGIVVWLLVHRGDERAPLIEALRRPAQSDLSLSSA